MVQSLEIVSNTTENTNSFLSLGYSSNLWPNLFYSSFVVIDTAYLHLYSISSEYTIYIINVVMKGRRKRDTKQTFLNEL